MIIAHRFLFLLFPLVLLFSSVRAEDDYSNLDGGRQKLKSIRDLERARSQLEKAYQAALALPQDSATKRKLIASQKAWIVYRDLVINLNTPKDDDWGSGTFVMLNLGEIHLIEDRIKVMTPGAIFW